MKPNVHGLPPHLRKDAKGYFLDYFVQEGGIKRRKRERLGNIPRAQALTVLAHHSREIVERRFLGIEKPKTTFNQAADSFLAYSQARKRTYNNDRQIVGKLKAFFGDRELESLTLDDVEDFLNQRRELGNIQRPGQPLSASTLNHDIAALKSIVLRAVKNRLIERNPVIGVKKFKETARDRTLTPEETLRLFQELPPHLLPIVKLAYWTGMRRGEIFRLRWDQVDLQGKVINLQAADTKTQEKREVPLCGTLVEMFRRLPRTLGSPFVFTYRGKPIRSIKTAWLRACHAAAIEDFKFHDLRHCAVTNLRKAGVGDSVIMSISGHKTYAMFKRYNKIDRKDRLDALEQVDRLNDTGMTQGEKLEALK